MKTYTKTVTVTKPLLRIEHEEYPENPRKNQDNLGFFITKERDYQTPDKNEDLQNIVEGTGELANNTQEHIELITERVQEELGYHVEAIYPVNRYEHSGVSYSIVPRSGWDVSNCGFYIITTESMNVLGTPKKFFEKVVRQELAEYTAWANGEVYAYTLYDEKGEEIDSCGGFYNIEDMRSSLPKEWSKEDLDEYLVR